MSLRKMTHADATKTIPEGQPSLRTDRGIAKAAGILSALTLVSRVAGLARDVVVGAVFGASPAADAFFVAFRIPNLFRRIVAEGAASSAFVPVFTAERARGGPVAAAEASRVVGWAAGVWLTVLVLVGMAFSDQVVALFAPGFTNDPSKLALTVQLTRLTFPYLLLVGLAAWAMGTLHSFGRFAAPALGPVLLNVAIIGSVLSLSSRMNPPVLALVVGVLVGGFLQFVVQWPSLRAVGVKVTGAASPWSHPAVRRVGGLLLPTVVGGAVYQINILVATMFASLLPNRSVSYLWYADRIFEFPLGIVAVAIGTAALPTLSGQAATGRYDEMGRSVAYSLRLVWAICLPATLGLWILAPQIVEALFERGQFDAMDSAMTAWALRAYVLGLLSVAAVRVLVSVFYALEQPRVPVRVAIVALVVNVVTDLALMGPTDATAAWWGASLVATAGDALRIADLRHAGLALGTGVAATVNAGLLFWLAARKLPVLLHDRLGRSFLLHGLATLVMGAVVIGFSTLVRASAGDGSAWLEVLGGSVIGAAIYVVTALALGSTEISGIKNLLFGRIARSLSRPAR
jgi:putative peptidoglycan lipid II flippase